MLFVISLEKAEHQKRKMMCTQLFKAYFIYAHPQESHQFSMFQSFHCVHRTGSAWRTTLCSRNHPAHVRQNVRRAPPSRHVQEFLHRLPRQSSSGPRPNRLPAPGNFPDSDLVSSALAVRSSNHEPITLPRRQSSVISGRLRSYW